MTPFGFYERDSWLQRRNPTAKLAAHLILSLAVTVVFDPVTPLAFVGLALLTGRILGRIPLALLARALAPFWLLAASLIASNALFVETARRQGVLWSWGPLTATRHGALIGLSLAERGVAIAAFSVLFLLSTDPTALIRSLVQQARLPARIAYPALAAYRFLPLLRGEYETLTLARRLRGYGRRRRPLGGLRERVTLIVPLLAGAIRKAERVAVAMDARGFDTTGPRSQYRRICVTATDGLMVTGALALCVMILGTSAVLGVLHIWAGTLRG